jgi:peptidoglycan/LPS O-acetylase OafA/YrhL
LSLFWLNRLPGLDMWAPYFVGSYGLGALAFWLSALNPRSTARLMGTLGMAALVLIALWLEWRSRIALAGIAALSLVLVSQGRLLQDWARLPVVQWLSRSSYSVFLAHYPVIVLVGAMSQCLWPDSLTLNLFSLFLAWGLSLAAGQLLHLGVEQRQGRAGRKAVPTGNRAIASVNT